MWLNYLFPDTCLKLLLFEGFVIVTIICVNAENKHATNILMDFDYLVSQLYVQHCTFVEIGEGFCSIFVELPLDPTNCRKRSVPRQLYFGNCLCSEFRSWQLCSHQLAQARPDDCAFEEGIDCPTTSARVHRRLCDVTGMSQWNSQCNCSVPLAGQVQEPLCGFRTCYSNPLPASICTPRTVCGTARCDISLHGAVYGVKCDRKCKDRQSFCENAGPATSLQRPVTSEWSEWKLLNCDDRSSSIQQHEAECFDSENKPAFDCLGPGMFCCGKDDLDCICEVKQEDGRLKAYRYTITFGSSTEPDHASLQVRSAVGFSGQAKVWNRLLNIGLKDDDSDSLFSNQKDTKTINQNEVPEIQGNLKDLIKENLNNLLSSGVNIDKSNITLAQGFASNNLKNELDLKNDSVIPLVLQVEPTQNPLDITVIVTPLTNLFNYTDPVEHNAITDQVGNISGEAIVNDQINKDESSYHYTPAIHKDIEKAVTLKIKEKGSNKRPVGIDENNEIIKTEKENVITGDNNEEEKLEVKKHEGPEKENDDQTRGENINTEGGDQQSNNDRMLNSQQKIDDSQLKQHTSNFFEGSKIKDGGEIQKPTDSAQKEHLPKLQLNNETTGLVANLTNKDTQLTKQTNNSNEIVKSKEENKSRVMGSTQENPNINIKASNITKSKDISPQSTQSHEQAKYENNKSYITETGKNQTGKNSSERLIPNIAKLLPNNASQIDSSLPTTNTSKNESKPDEVQESATISTTFNVSGIIVKNLDTNPNGSTPDRIESTTSSTTYNWSGIIVREKFQTTWMPGEKKAGKSNTNFTKEILSKYKDDLEALSKLNPKLSVSDKEDERKSQTSFYDEPEPVLKDLDKDSVEDNFADVLNNVVGGKNEWVEKKVQSKDKKTTAEENLEQEKKVIPSDSDKASLRKGKSENDANFHTKMKKRKFHSGQ